MGCLTAKASGSIASFISPTVTPIESARVYFSPTQLGEGTPSPENVREIVGRTSVELKQCGKNLFPSADGAKSPLRLKKGTAITISQSADVSVGYFRGYDKDNNAITSLVWINEGIANGRRYKNYTLEDDIYYAAIYVGTGMKDAQVTVDGSIGFEPYQGTTIPFTWKRLPDEYQEVEYIESTGTQAILTDIPCQLPIKTDIDIMFTQSNDSYFCGTRYGDIRICSGGNYQNNIQWAFGTYKLTRTNDINLNTRYLLSTFLNNGNQLVIRDGDTIGTYEYTLTESEITNMDGNLALFAMWINNSQTFGLYTKAKCYGVKISNNNDLLGNFIPCYRKSDNEIGMYDTVSQTFYTNQGTGTFLKGDDVFSDEVYGGYVDLVNGEIVDEYYSVPYTAWGVYKQNNGYICYKAVQPTHLGDWHCNVLNTYGSFSSNAMNKNIIQKHGSTLDSTGSIYMALDENVDISMVQVIYKIAVSTPITHSLPDYLKTQLQTLKNENTFWSDANSVEIEYGLAETFDIQKAKRKIIMNQPHVETLTGDAVSFTTDMKAPLKECKVSFMPIQEGSGDPSPDNVRNITGWNEITGGLPSEYQEVEYIENTGEQYLLTDFIYRKDLDNPRIEWKYMQVANPVQDNMLFGYTAVGGAVYYECYAQPTRIYGGVGGNSYSSITITSSASLNNIAICSMTKAKLNVNEGTYSYSKTYTDLTTVNSMAIFAWTNRTNTGVEYINKGARLYYLRFLNNDTKMAEFIPCYRKSDNEIGMYDTVSKQFYTNQGTGTFLKGNDVNNISIDADFKPVTELKNKFNGNIMWNQLLPSTEKSGSHTPVGTQKYDTYRAFSAERLTIGHIYFIWATFTYNGDRTDIRPYMQQSTSQNYVRGGASRFFNLNGIGHEMEFGGFVNVTNAGNVTLGITTNQANLTEEWSYDNLMLIDCTMAFGEEIANYYLNAPQYEAQAWFRNLFPDTYYEYNTGESIAKEFYWGDGITYGGYVDLVSGKLVDEWKLVDLSSITPKTRYTGEVNKTISLELPFSYLSYPYSSFKGIKCSTYKYIQSVRSASILTPPDEYNVGLYTYSNANIPTTKTIYFILPKETELSGYIVYCTLEPSIYQLTPQQLVALKGQNDLWTDSNETIDVKYWTH